MLRKSRHVALFVSLLVTLPFHGSALAAAAPSPNRLENPGFEQGIPGHPWMPSGWDTSRAGLSSVFFGRDTLLAHGGQYAVTVANVSDVWTFSHNWSQAILVDSKDWGKDAVLDIWTRSTGVEGRAYVMLQVYRDTLSYEARRRGVPRDSMSVLMGIRPIDDPAFDLGWKRTVFTEEETPWIKREARVYVPPLTNVIFVRCGLIGTGQLMLDDASLTFEAPLPAPTLQPGVNLLKDPSFEQGGLDWEFSVPPYRNTIGRVDSTVARTGHNSAYFKSGEMGFVTVGSGVCQTICNRNLGGMHFKMSGWFKTDSLVSTAYTLMYFSTPHGVVSIPTKDRYSLTNNWVQATLEADAPKDTYSMWVWYEYNAPAAGELHIDDCSLEVTGPAKGNGAKAPGGH
jgi:hypothetical protein